MPVDEQRAGDEEGREGAGDDADEQGEGKAADDLAAEDEQGDDDDERQARGEDGAAEGLIEAFVDDRRKVVPPPAAHVFAHAVEDDDGVVQGVADDGQQCRHDLQVEFTVENRQQPHGDEHVVIHGDQRRQRVVQPQHQAEHRGDGQGDDDQDGGRDVGQPLRDRVRDDENGARQGQRDEPLGLEAPGQVDHDAQHGVKQGEQRLAPQIGADLRPHHFHPQNFHLLLRELLLQGGLQLRCDVRHVLVRPRHPDQHFVVAAEMLHDALLQTHRRQRLAHHAELHVLPEAQVQQGAAAEVDALFQAAVQRDGDQADQDDRQRGDDADLGLADEVDAQSAGDQFKHEGYPGFPLSRE